MHSKRMQWRKKKKRENILESRKYSKKGIREGKGKEKDLGIKIDFQKKSLEEVKR